MYLNPTALHVDGNYAEIMKVHLIFKISQQNLNSRFVQKFSNYGSIVDLSLKHQTNRNAYELMCRAGTSCGSMCLASL